MIVPFMYNFRCLCNKPVRFSEVKISHFTAQVSFTTENLKFSESKT